jgi:hypothetical protein
MLRFHIPGCITFHIKDWLGNMIFCGDGDIINHQASVQVQWPTTPGNYSITAVCKGAVLGNELGTHSINFSVV